MFYSLFFMLFFSAHPIQSNNTPEENIDLAECTCGNGIQDAYPQSNANPACPYKLYGSTTEGPSNPSYLYAINTYNGDSIEIGK